MDLDEERERERGEIVILIYSNKIYFAQQIYPYFMPTSLSTSLKSGIWYLPKSLTDTFVLFYINVPSTLTILSLNKKEKKKLWQL